MSTYWYTDMGRFKCHAYFNSGKKDINVSALDFASFGKEKAVLISIQSVKQLSERVL